MTPTSYFLKIQLNKNIPIYFYEKQQPSLQGWSVYILCFVIPDKCQLNVRKPTAAATGLDPPSPNLLFCSK